MGIIERPFWTQVGLLNRIEKMVLAIVEERVLMKQLIQRALCVVKTKTITVPEV